MTQTYSNELAGIASNPVVKPSATAAYGARMRRYRATVSLAGQVFGAGNEIILAKVPAGLTFAFGVINTDTSLGTSTVAIGNIPAGGSWTTKYLNAETLTSTNAAQVFSLVADEDAAFYSVEEVIAAQVGVANLPASGNLVMDLYFSSPT